MERPPPYEGATHAGSNPVNGAVTVVQRLRISRCDREDDGSVPSGHPNINRGYMPIKDPVRRREYERLRQSARRARYFEGRKCVSCGATGQLEIDHIDPMEKSSHRIWSWAEPRLQAELRKCQPLCKRCHRDKTTAQMPLTHGTRPTRHGTSTMYDRWGCRCGLCRLAARNRKRDYRKRLAEATND